MTQEERCINQLDTWIIVSLPGVCTSAGHPLVAQCEGQAVASREQQNGSQYRQYIIIVIIIIIFLMLCISSSVSRLDPSRAECLLAVLYEGEIRQTYQTQLQQQSKHSFSQKIISIINYFNSNPVLSFPSLSFSSFDSSPPTVPPRIRHF
jgi:Na+/melibiose symporter-like transporter